MPHLAYEFGNAPIYGLSAYKMRFFPISLPVIARNSGIFRAESVADGQDARICDQ
jgi:hypothetical protein